MLNNNAAFNYYTPYKGTFEMTQCWNKSTVTLQCGAIKIGYNIHCIKPYTSDTNVEDIISEK